MTLDWLQHGAKGISHPCREQAMQFQAALTNPPGSLGVMQKITIDFAGWQGHNQPNCESVLLQVFDANEKASSAAPTGSPITSKNSNMDSLAAALERQEAVLNLHTQDEAPGQTKLQSDPITRALHRGYTQVMDCRGDLLVSLVKDSGTQTAANQIYTTLLNSEGNSSDRSKFHQTQQHSLINLLKHVQGLHLAILIGSYIGAARVGIPILVNGFIATAAALISVRLNPSTREWMIFTHQGEQPYQQRAMQRLRAQPLLDEQLEGCERTYLTTAIDVIRSSLSLNLRMSRALPPYSPYIELQ